MINLIGAYITLIFVVAVLYHRPPVLRAETSLAAHSTILWGVVAFLFLLLANEVFGLFSLGKLFLPFTYIDLFIETTTLWIHEAGHVYWSWGGKTLAVLGGTLNEVVFPLGCFLYCSYQGAHRIASIALFWLGKNLFGVSIYIADASLRKLPLLGGAEIHDWEYLLKSAGLLSYDKTLSGLVWGVGVTLCLAVIVFLASKAAGRSLWPYRE